MSSISANVEWSASGDDEHQHGDHHDLITQEATPKLKRPPMYQVVLLNDDYTPMEFVIEVLMLFFSMDEESATEVMLAVHHKGKGVCGVYTKDVAETKSAIVNQFSREHKHPLLSQVECH